MHRSIRIGLLAVVFVSSAISTPAQSTHYVPSAAFPTIQSAINAAGNEDTIMIAAGVYAESLTISGKSLHLVGAGAGIGPGKTTITGFGVDRCLRISDDLGFTGNVTLTGIAFHDGAPPSGDPYPRSIQGGGIHIEGSVSYVRIFDCEIRDCSATLGGGIYHDAHANLLIDNTRIFNNSWIADPTGNQEPRGAGLYVVTHCYLWDSEFWNNVMPRLSVDGISGSGGAVCLDCQAPSVLGTMAVNRETYIDQCVFENNSAENGGAIFTDGSNTRSLRSIYRGNQGGSGCGAFEALEGHSDVFNCLFHDNATESGVKAIRSTGLTSIDRVTATRNDPAEATLPVMKFDDPAAQNYFFNLTNNIIWNNGNDDIDVEVIFYYATITEERNLLGGTVHYFDSVASGLPLYNWGSISPYLTGLDPGFVDPANDDFHLQPTSPAIDCGYPLWNRCRDYELDWNPSEVGFLQDLGCYEVQYPNQSAIFNGNVVDAQGTTVDTFFVNGLPGDSRRRLLVSMGAPLILGVLPPPGDVQSDFVLFGKVGITGQADATSIPFAQGAMVFPPNYLNPLDPSLVAVADSTGYVPALIQAHSAPWNLTITAAPFPMSITLQGLQTFGPNEIRVTNAITLHSH